jgi:predicted RND superfamily exporter protein
MTERKSGIAVLIILAITLLSLIPLRSLRFDFNIEKLFPAGDPELTYFQKFQQQFNSQIDDEFIFIGLKNNTGIFRPDFLQKTDSLTRYIAGLNNIIKVYSLTTSNIIYFDKDEFNARPLVHTLDSSKYTADSAYLFQAQEFRNLLISKDGRSIAIAAFNKQRLTNDQKDSILDGISNKIKELGFDETHLTAKIRVERIYEKEIAKNLQKYLLLSLALICFTLYVLFRSLKTLVLPLLIIVVSITWTLSLIALTGHTLDIISSLLPPILATICMSDVIHITTHYIEQLRSGLPKKQALDKAYKEIGLATFYTCCTIAVGFITLGITDIVPIRNFGFFAAAGILIGFVITMFSLYAFYLLSPIPALVYKKDADHQWNRLLAFCFRSILKKKILVFSILALVTTISVYYTTRIEINSSLLQEIPRKNKMLDDYHFMEKDFAGTRPFEMELTIKDSNSSFLEIAKMKQVEEVENFLKDSCGIGYIISPLSLFRGANKAFKGGNNADFNLPDSQKAVARYYEGIMQTEYADELQHYLTPDGKRLRISGRLPNLSVKEFEPVREKIAAYFVARKDRFSFIHEVTGSGVLLDKVTYSLTSNLFTGIFFDALIICIIALLLLRRWSILFIILIPNVLPLVFMSGIMGLLHINLKADTSVIFAIALGLTVDDSIHFLSRLRIELGRGLSLPYAVKRTYLSTGKAIVITAFILLSGFMTLLSSSFGGTFYIGLLVSLCLFTAMILELTVTPLLILLFFRTKRKAHI